MKDTMSWEDEGAQAEESHRKGDCGRKQARWDDKIDLGTKPLDADSIGQHLTRLGFEPASGRAAAAPQLKSEAGK